MIIRTFSSLRPVYALMLCLACVYAITIPPLYASEVQVGRYSALRAMPSAAQADLLSTIITVRIPERIQTIGEAVRYLLQRSGYRLADHHAVNSVTVDLFGLI